MPCYFCNGEGRPFKVDKSLSEGPEVVFICAQCYTGLGIKHCEYGGCNRYTILPTLRGYYKCSVHRHETEDMPDMVCKRCKVQITTQNVGIGSPLLCKSCVQYYSRCSGCKKLLEKRVLRGINGIKWYCEECYHAHLYPPLTAKKEPSKEFVMGAQSQKVGNVFFGTEIECYQSSHKTASNMIVDKLPRWGWTRDGSIVCDNKYEQYPVEFLSPPLHGEDGINELGEAVKTIKDNGFKTNQSCGFHVHVNARDMDWDHVRNSVIGWMHLQPYVFDVLPPKRKESKHCRPLSHTLWELRNCCTQSDLFQLVYGMPLNQDNLYRKKTHKYDQARYHDLNLHSYWFKQTLEFRLFPASLSAVTICDWVELVTKLVYNCRTTPGWTQQAVLNIFPKRLKRKFDLKLGKFPELVYKEPEVVAPAIKPEENITYRRVEGHLGNTTYRPMRVNLDGTTTGTYYTWETNNEDQ